MDYSFIIQKLTVSCRDVPRFYNYILPLGPSNPTGSPIQTLYTVYLSYGGNFYRTVVQHVPEGNYQTPPNLTTESPYQNLQDYAQFYAINSIQHWLNMLNTAFQTSMTALLTANPALGSVSAPYFQLDNQTGLITLYAPYPQFSSTAPTPIYAYVNFRTRAILKNFPYYDMNNGIYRYVFTDPSGSPTQTICQQETVQLDSFSTAMVELIVKSNSFPVNPTVIDTPQLVGQNVQGNNNLNLLATQGYINSYSILDTPAGNSFRVYSSYVPTGQYRKLTMINNQPILRVNIAVYYKDIYGNEFPLILSPGDFINLLVLFERIDEDNKDVYK